MALKHFEIHGVTVLPIKGSPGDWYILQKGINRNELYVVDPRGNLTFNKGITDEEQERLVNDYTNTQLDYKLSTLDNKIDNHELGVIGSITTAQTLGQLNALPDGVYEAQTSGNYANGQVADVGYYTKFKKEGTVWTLLSKVKLPDNVDVFNVTRDVPLSSGYYNEITARAAVPIPQRRIGLVITYQKADKEWETQQYVHNVVGPTWDNKENWAKYDPYINYNYFTFISNKSGINLNDYIESIIVTIRNTDKYTPNTYKKIAISGFGYISGTNTYSLFLSEWNGVAWSNQESEDRFSYVGPSPSLTFNFPYKQYLVNVKLKKWPTDYTDYKDNNIINPEIFDTANNLNELKSLRECIYTFGTNSDIDNYNTYDSSTLTRTITHPVTGVLVLPGGSVLTINTEAVSVIKSYKIKRQEFLYVDVPKRCISLGVAVTGPHIIQHGKYAGGAITDERGTIPAATLTSADPLMVRVVLYAVGYSAYMEIKNMFPKVPTKEQVQTLINNSIPDINSDILVKASTYNAEKNIRESILRNEYQYKVNNESYIGKWYGVQYTEQANDNTIRINSTGDDNLHINLPIQSLMRRCIVKNGKVQYYLHPTNSNLKSDGITPSKLDGTDGNVMVEIPEFFYKVEEEIVGGNKVVKVKISQDAFPDFKYSNKRYTSAYESTVDRNLNKLVSVCTTNFTRNSQNIYIEAVNFYAEGTSADYSLGVQNVALNNGYTSNAANYRGGTNDSSLDTATGNQIARCQLGRPIANVRRGDVKALLKEDEFIHQYDTHKILWFLAYTEYAKRNIQVPIVQKNPSNVTQGGLGKGACVYPYYNGFQNFFLPYGGISIIPCGVTNSLGNNSGEVYYKLENVPVEGTGDKETYATTRVDNVWMPVMSYRGIENYYGHVYKILDQVTVINRPTGKYTAGHEGEWEYAIVDTSYYYEPNPYLTNNNTPSNKLIWRGEFQGYATLSKQLLGENGHVLPTGGEGFADNHYCDCVEFFQQGENGLYPTVNARSVSDRLPGYNFMVAHNYDGGLPRASDGTRIDTF